MSNSEPVDVVGAGVAESGGKGRVSGVAVVKSLCVIDGV